MHTKSSTREKLFQLQNTEIKLELEKKGFLKKEKKVKFYVEFLLRTIYHNMKSSLTFLTKECI